MRPVSLLALLALGLAPRASALTFEQTIALPAIRLIPQLKLAAFTDRDEDSLIALLSDEDPAVRAQAARSLKAFALTGRRAEGALLNVVADSWQPETVRREAVKSLSWAAQNANTRDRLVNLARDGSQTASLRGIACKALYVSAGVDARTAQTLRDLLRDSSEQEPVRAGAAWALFADVADRQTTDALRGAAADSSLSTPGSARFESVRSLYLAMGDRPVQDAVKAIAADQWSPLPLRVAAVLAHHAVNTESGVHPWLLEVAQDQSQPALRAAALQALEDGESLDFVRYFHLTHYRGQAVDPLTNE
jgi:hypothetical protein